MLDVAGPLTGPFAKRLTPENGNQGATGPYAGGELDIEFQSRAVEDLVKRSQRQAPNETSWTLATDLEIIQC